MASNEEIRIENETKFKEVWKTYLADDSELNWHDQA